MNMWRFSVLSAVIAVSCVTGAIVGISLAGPSVHAQDAGFGVPQALTTDARVFVQRPENVTGAFTIRQTSGPWVLMEQTDGGQVQFRRYWVYGPNYSWGVEGAFTQPAQR